MVLRGLWAPKTLIQFNIPCYACGMSLDTQALLEAFEHLPIEEKRAFTDAVLLRSLPLDSGPQDPARVNR